MDFMGPMFHGMHEALKKNNYRSPTDAQRPLFNYALGVDGPFFGYVKSNPYIAEAFDMMMKAHTVGRISWLDMYPVREKVMQDAARDGPIFVDIGGGIGQDSDKFVQAFPECSGRIILQDQAHVVERATVGPDVKIMGHDFFMPQPVKGQP